VDITCVLHGAENDYIIYGLVISAVTVDLIKILNTLAVGNAGSFGQKTIESLPYCHSNFPEIA